MRDVRVDRGLGVIAYLRSAAQYAKAAAARADETADARVRMWFQKLHSRTYAGQYADASGDSASAFITKLEKAKNTPPISPAPMQVASESSVSMGGYGDSDV